MYIWNWGNSTGVEKRREGGGEGQRQAPAGRGRLARAGKELRVEQHAQGAGRGDGEDGEGKTELARGSHTS